MVPQNIIQNSDSRLFGTTMGCFKTIISITTCIFVQKLHPHENFPKLICANKCTMMIVPLQSRVVKNHHLGYKRIWEPYFSPRIVAMYLHVKNFHF